jgi:hypothetical protein
MNSALLPLSMSRAAPGRACQAAALAFEPWAGALRRNQKFSRASRTRLGDLSARRPQDAPRQGRARELLFRGSARSRPNAATTPPLEPLLVNQSSDCADAETATIALLKPDNLGHWAERGVDGVV